VCVCVCVCARARVCVCVCVLCVYYNVSVFCFTQKWMCISADTDASNYSQASCQDANITLVLNPSLLDHAYSPKDIIEHSSMKTNLSIRMPASNCNSRSSTERIELSSSSSSLSEETVDVTNSKPPDSENRKKFCFTSTSSLQHQNSTSIQNKKRANKDLVYVKRGTMKKATIMEEAVEALKKISDEKMPQLLQSPSHTPADACEHLGLFIATRLREMEPDIRFRCETEILKILTTAMIETREKNT